jgi:hypothetical protein
MVQGTFKGVQRLQTFNPMDSNSSFYDEEFEALLEDLRLKRLQNSEVFFSAILFDF